MKMISDIRLFRSTVANIDGNSHPSSFGSKQLYTIIHRIVMKLREQNFSLGEYDHLYLNFTTQLVAGTILHAARSIDPYHKWYRYYDIGISRESYKQLDSESSLDFVIGQLESVLISFFSAENTCSIHECISEAIEKGEEMLILYKTKQTPELKASIFLQYLNNGYYLPHLLVWNSSGDEILHERLDVSMDLMSIGEIQLSSKKVTIKPRKSSFTLNLSSSVFEL